MKSKNLIESFKNAISGIFYAIRQERNMKIHIAAFVIVTVLSIYYKLTRPEFLIVCLTVSIVFISELLNTSIELLVDIVTDHYHPKAKVIKDIAAGAVFVSSLTSLTVAYFLFFDRIILDVKKGIIIVEQSPVYFLVISFAAAVSAVLLVFVFFNKKKS